MKSWKDTLDKTIDINAMLAQYDAIVRRYKSHCEDLEAKLKTLHECAYYAYNSTGDLLNEINQENEPMTHQRLGDIRHKMESILSRDNSETPKIIESSK